MEGSYLWQWSHNCNKPPQKLRPKYSLKDLYLNILLFTTPNSGTFSNTHPKLESLKMDHRDVIFWSLNFVNNFLKSVSVNFIVKNGRKISKNRPVKRLTPCPNVTIYSVSSFFVVLRIMVRKDLIKKLISFLLRKNDLTDLLKKIFRLTHLSLQKIHKCHSGDVTETI